MKAENVNFVDFTDDILDYLRQRRGKTTPTMTMIGELSSRIKNREQRRVIRGNLLHCLSALIRENKVIRYRKVTMVRRRPRSSQGLLRISERFC